MKNSNTKILKGYAYHIKDEYFTMVNDPKLMQNKEDGRFRPTYYCVKDRKTGLLWMIPLSSKIEKYRVLYDKQIAKYGESLKVIIAPFGNSSSAFLLQNMFPVTEQYVSHIHKDGDKPVRLKNTVQKEITEKIARLRLLYKKGIKFVHTDIDRLEQLMLAELQQQTDKQTEQDNSK